MLLSLAVLLPPHARVNYRCYPVWNERRDNLDVVWDGERHKQPWVFDREVSGEECTADSCVQRLWCTDSGAVGRCTLGTQQAGPERGSVLAFTWLRNTALRGRRVLALRSRAGTMASTSLFSASTLVVVGSTLFFYANDDADVPVRLGLPRLTSLVFAEYEEGMAADQLVATQLRAFNVLGFADAYRWRGSHSPLYPAGSSALTLSVQDFDIARCSAELFCNRAFVAVDVALTVRGAAATRHALIHSHGSLAPSAMSAARETLAVPGFACRAPSRGPVLCHRVGEGARLTWDARPQTAFGWSFAPIAALPRFALPSALWLHDAAVVAPFPSRAFRVLASTLGTAFSLEGGLLRGVESLPDASCASGRRLFLVVRDVPAMAELRREALACEWRQVFPASDDCEAPYAAGVVKGLGWGGPLFVATDVEAHEYHMLGAADTSTGDPVIEHVAHLTPDSGTIRLGALSCAWRSQRRVPTDAEVLARAVALWQTDCARHLLEAGRGDVRATDALGTPLLMHASTAELALLLVDHGADLEAKDRDGTTSLMVMARHGQPLDGHLRRGAAVCTSPWSIFDVDGVSAGIDARAYPCEPGFWLQEGANCTGLTPCEAGFVCPGQRACTNGRLPCPAGTYGPHACMAALTQCRRCPAGRPFSPPGSPDASWCAAEERTSSPRVAQADIADMLLTHGARCACEL